MPFTKEELSELKVGLNELISGRQIYLNSDIKKHEEYYTMHKLEYDYELLRKVLKLIGEEESK